LAVSVILFNFSRAGHPRGA